MAWMKSQAWAATQAVRISSGVASRFAAVGDVVRQRVVEQHHVLRHQRDVAAQVLQADVADVDAVEFDHAGIGIVETRHQIGQRGLARARGADQRHRFAGRDVERDVVKRRQRSCPDR